MTYAEEFKRRLKEAFPACRIRIISNQLMEQYCPDSFFEITINSMDCKTDCNHCWEREYEGE